MRTGTLKLLFLTLLISSSRTTLPMAYVRNIGKSAAHLLASGCNRISLTIRIASKPVTNFMKKRPTLTSYIVGCTGYIAGHIAYQNRRAIGRAAISVARTCRNVLQFFKNLVASRLPQTGPAPVPVAPGTDHQIPEHVIPGAAAVAVPEPAFFELPDASTPMRTATPAQPTAAPTLMRTATPAQSAPKQIECPICFEDTADFVTLACGHRACRGCLTRMLDTAIPTHSSATLFCPNRGCLNAQGNRTALTMADFALFATLDRYASIEEIMTNETFDRPDSGIKHCPTAGCQARFPVEDNRPMLRQCDCGHRYCVQCLTEHRETTSCEIARAERGMSPEERANAEWTREHTKSCPNCHKNIEKNEGCNHMTCQRRAGGCGHEFCWLCLHQWDGTCNYYQCNRQPRAAAPVAAGIALGDLPPVAGGLHGPVAWDDRGQFLPH